MKHQKFFLSSQKKRKHYSKAERAAREAQTEQAEAPPAKRQKLAEELHQPLTPQNTPLDPKLRNSAFTGAPNPFSHETDGPVISLRLHRGTNGSAVQVVGKEEQVFHRLSDLARYLSSNATFFDKETNQVVTYEQLMATIQPELTLPAALKLESPDDRLFALFRLAQRKNPDFLKDDPVRRELIELTLRQLAGESPDGD